MPDQIIGYYSTRQAQLLKEFDHITALIKASVVERYGKDFTDTLQREARKAYQELIPEIPYLKGMRAKMLNSFLVVTAQELAVYKAMKNHGKTPGETWELCHEAIRLKMAEMPQWKRGLFRRLMFSGLVKKIVAKRAQRQEKGRFGDFEIAYLAGEEDAFDFGANYLRCGNHTFAKTHGGEAFVPYICMSDIALSEALGWGLTRTQTLADGCSHCDFRFKAGAATQISSKTPEVQETIERIREREAEQGTAVPVP